MGCGFTWWHMHVQEGLGTGIPCTADVMEMVALDTEELSSPVSSISWTSYSHIYRGWHNWSSILVHDLHATQVADEMHPVISYRSSDLRYIYLYDIKMLDHNALYHFALYVPICFQLCRIDLIYFIWFLTAWSGRTWWISWPQWWPWPWPSLICSLKLFHGISSGEAERQYSVYAATLTFKIGSLLFLFGWLALVSFSFLVLLLLQHLR